MPVNRNQSDELFDVVIIGAGAAGITLALQLGKAGIKTALVEGGDYDFSPVSQDLYQGFNEGLYYSLASSRLRYFGGTTNHWDGWCRPLNPAAFIPRTSIDYPGWPIDRPQVTPYLTTALEILDIDPSVAWEPSIFEHPSDFDNALSESGFKEIYFHWSKPTRFKEKYLQQLEKTSSVTISVNDSLVDFEFTAEGEIEGAVLRNLETGDNRVINGKQFVLACGGIENARLLLHTNKQHSVDFGNSSGHLGKHFMEHPLMLYVGNVIIFDKTYNHKQGYIESRADWKNNYRFFCLTDNLIRYQRMLPAYIQLSMLEDPEDQNNFIDEFTTATNFTRQNHWQVGSINIMSEQLPSTNNSITLSDEVDKLGIGKTILNWQLESIDYYSIRQSLLYFAKFMIDADLGRCKFDPWITDNQQIPRHVGWGNHHMGATRMASTASEGVVDINCKLYGTKNLYVAGSSVFPTSDYANPTLTIVQLTLRLADHLKNRLSE